MKQLRILVWFIFMFLVACAQQTTVESEVPTAIVVAELETAVPPTPTLTTPVEPPVVVATATAVPATVTLVPDMQPTETAVPPAATQMIDDTVLAENLIQTMTTVLQAEKGTDAAFGGYEGLFVERLPYEAPLPIWMVYSIGFRPFDPPASHFVALFLYDTGTWQEIGRVLLENPNIVFDAGVSGWELNGRYWLEIESGVGAHGGCYDLLRLDQGILTHDISHCHSSPGGAGFITDTNHDGLPEVTLNFSDQYVFCYACGVTYFAYQLQTFDGISWQPVELTRLAGDDEAVRLNNEAVRLAQAGIWYAALPIISQVESLDPAIFWNRIIIERHTQAFVNGVDHGFFPLIEWMFLGNYAHAVDEMRPFSVEAILSQDENPLLVGTPAEGYGDLAAERMIEVLNPAIAAVPDAAAYYLRGWARYMLNPVDPLALADLEQAAALAPEDVLFAESVAFLR
ncbi:MAG: hypothetical protein GY943_33420 [Chloroflexi bacterium]|nr:hypothetical protein [Chloroflexota bacterium]